VDLEQALAELELTDAEELSPDRVRRAYIRQVRAHPPERDPTGFQRVRSAYEFLQGVEQPRAAPRSPSSSSSAAPPPLEVAHEAEASEADPSDSTTDVAATPEAEEERNGDDRQRLASYIAQMHGALSRQDRGSIDVAREALLCVSLELSAGRT
jgi:hypothetical protein